MGYARLFSRAECGLEAPLVTVEVHLSGGLPALSIVGLAATAVRESRDRVRGALLSSGFDFPVSRIIVNLAPADLPKHGGRFDLAIALGILAASGQIPDDLLAGFESFAELTLSGRLAPVTGVLPACLQTYNSRRQALVATANAPEAALPQSASVLAANTLLDVAAHLQQRHALPEFHRSPSRPATPPLADMGDVHGQAAAKRALEIAAAGGHNVLLEGPPGTGKSMLAARLPGLLPPMSTHEALECASIQSLLGFHHEQHGCQQRPFRSPHHSATAPALIGGGSQPRPGEVSRAHNGVLFLDELPEFSRQALEMLREPLESGRVHIARAAMSLSFPARFQLIAAMNPCPCGYYGDLQRECRCSSEQVQRYRNRVSGPLLDRIDLSVSVARVPFSTLTDQAVSESSARIAQRVTAARDIAIQRQGVANASLPAAALRSMLASKTDAMQLLAEAVDRFALSARICHRVCRVARTIADLAGQEIIMSAHMAEALALRLDEVAIDTAVV
ncbi:MAG: YifB family Mg chelatase-like AAA ATPase [Pseudomonadota bacterium]